MSADMKKLTSFIFAFASTVLLLAGAARAAEQLDTIASHPSALSSGTIMDEPTLPCLMNGNQN